MLRGLAESSILLLPEMSFKDIKDQLELMRAHSAVLVETHTSPPRSENLVLQVITVIITIGVHGEKMKVRVKI